MGVGAGTTRRGGYPFRSALVTGASSGIGDAMVRMLARAGVATIVVARRVDRLELLADELSGEPGAVEVMAADLSTDDGVEAVGARLEDGEAEPIDLLVNNAGFGTSGRVAEIAPGRMHDELEVNVVALTRLTRSALPLMLERRRGWILNVSSVASFQPAPQLAVYAATKAYVTSFTEALHEELRGTGVRATALCPGLTKTEFVEVSRGAEAAAPATSYPAMAWLSAEEVASEGLRDAARGRALSIPGVQYKALVTTSGFIPRGLMRRMSGIATSFTR
jgi:short-subunit dehydrogenase